ncbi:hypothetical protein PUN28_004599 [Cardiocondyla obscurior]|uniref:Uncharacterized protein n=1 Tax=Cardiocondyla obscurior TaxID=286306 RepID=A0AAW2GE92_9HYME
MVQLHKATYEYAQSSTHTHTHTQEPDSPFYLRHSQTKLYVFVITVSHIFPIVFQILENCKR